MERQRFAQHLDSATQRAIDFARRYVINELAGDVSYLVQPNQSCDDNLREGEVIFPEDSLPEEAHHGPWAAERVVEFLWRDGRVPEWIDIAVAEVPDTGGIRVGLLCCGRFTQRDDLLYYSRDSVPPFGIKSPVLPPDWQDGDGKFDVNWRRDLIASTQKRRHLHSGED
jgi:hypothetical protein